MLVFEFLQNELFTTLEHQRSPDINRQGCGTPVHKTIIWHTGFIRHRWATQNNSPGGHSRWELQREEKLATG